MREALSTSGDFYHNFLRILHPNTDVPGVKPVAFLELYFDESGHSADKAYIVMAGYIAPAERWLGFADEWNAALVVAGVCRTDGTAGEFHMTDFEAKRGAFSGWTEEPRRSLLGNLMGIIDNHQLHATGFVVSTAWWKTISWKDEHPNHKPLEDPYHHVMQNAIATALTMTNHQDVAPDLFSPDGVACVFAPQEEFEPKAAQYMAAMAHFLTVLAAPTVTSITFALTNMPQLQAADIVAFELRWRLTCPNIDRWPMRQILKSGRGKFAGLPTGILANANLGRVEPIEFPTQVLQASDSLAKKLIPKRQRKRKQGI
ncbi:MAG: hypothetical protein AABO58_10490 [Acidobacteriota bacterium]